MNAIRIKQVAAKVGLGQSTLYRMIAAGNFPKPFELVPGRVAWIESDIDAWLAQRAGKTEQPEQTSRSESEAMQPMHQ